MAEEERGWRRPMRRAGPASSEDEEDGEGEREKGRG